VRSFFRWEGNVDVADECLLVVKTTRAAAMALRERIVALHPYQVPEVLELAVAGGLPSYLQWLAQSIALPPATP
jgi:periplasmic divalent cation tolerance protein